ncbi:hypothetical protein [Sphingomonas japonica]|uniref:Uncharacterized protein n=1 Tax=Sphingomonas japonica TaxID=511662 RepID=A0ABX0U232_9SPHN|nr:hypothetical protein [Sphingomonas japonica]NIJ24629.1 hypothetical protein [Sphingomonas japonica]
MADALATALDADLRALLTLRRDQLIDGGHQDLADIAHFVAVQPGDTLAAVEAEVGMPIATNLVDGTDFGQPDFTSSFEFIERHSGGWFEVVMILDDDGFALALFVLDDPNAAPPLPRLLRANA